ncbi:HlyD family efflux transporter periplasmic adaptor subunit [Synechococcus sp. CS-1328]|uniref:HlyD family efflux transporter periplasmic adaptor subunit n=1 Tax=Synechococcus sp. CS-1328 TaxID=2847976 RepID=UPI00223BE514|nr:HlyD family efflux transporter periplasmic adaptor subunit [Synechococcus sp. CS-1328]MCT0224687.1 HlyD family efflux transporter periplasmic adaptor subunit [Synechococcus sp. CS-1328]
MSASGPKAVQPWWERHRRVLIGAAALGLLAVGWSVLKPKPEPPPQAPLRQDVTALGRLTPEGGLVNLAIPSGSVGGSEVVQQWFAREGEPIRKGEVLVRLSSWDQLQASLRQAEANLNAARALLPSLKFSQSRARELFNDGGISEQELGEVQANVISKTADINTAKAALSLSRTQLDTAEVRSPMDGLLIRIYSWPGMKETDDGLALIGRADRMQVWAQVFQTDVNRLRIGQAAQVKAETGGFSGTIPARLVSIIRQVSARDLFATTGNNDVNARVVLVKLDLDPADRDRVKRLSGLNVLVRFPDS